MKISVSKNEILHGIQTVQNIVSTKVNLPILSNILMETIGNQLKLVRSKKTGLLFIGCQGYPKCTNSYPVPHNARIEKTGRVCGTCNTPIVKIVRKGKHTYEMCLDLACEDKKDLGMIQQ